MGRSEATRANDWQLLSSRNLESSNFNTTHDSTAIKLASPARCYHSSKHRREPIQNPEGPSSSVTMNAAQSAVGNLDLERLNDADKAELRQFLGNQQQRAQIQTRPLPLPVTPFALPSFAPDPRYGRRGRYRLLTGFPYRDTPAHAGLLEQVCARRRQEWEAGQRRGGVPSELREPIHGSQLPDGQAP